MESRGQEACSFCTQAPGCAQPGLGSSSHARSRGGEGTGHLETVWDPGVPGSQTLASWSQGQCCPCHTSVAEPWRVWEGPQLPAQGMDSLGPPAFQGQEGDGPESPRSREPCLSACREDSHEAQVRPREEGGSRDSRRQDKQEEAGRARLSTSHGGHPHAWAFPGVRGRGEVVAPPEGLSTKGRDLHSFLGFQEGSVRAGGGESPTAAQWPLHGSGSQAGPQVRR